MTTHATDATDARLAELGRENERLRKGLHRFDDLTPLRELTYHIIDENGRVCVYYTKPFSEAHHILWDSLDDERNAALSAQTAPQGEGANN